MRSDAVKKGSQQAPHRSLFNALGFTKEEMERPMVGIVSSYNEIVPGHMNLDKIVDAVKQGVAMAGGTPVVFPAIAVCDGIAMGHTGMKYSLVTRDLIADSTEAMAMAHLRILFRYVYCKLHELSYRGSGYGAWRKRNDPGRLF